MVDERGEDVMSDEICRRRNRKRQRRRRGGLSVQLPNWCMILHSSSRRVCTHTYVLRTTKYIRRKKKINTPSEVRSRDGNVKHVCINSGSISSNRVDIYTLVRKAYVFLRSCLWFLGFTVESSFCVMFLLIFNIGRSDLRMFGWNFYRQTWLGVPAVASFRKKGGGSFPAATPDHFWPFWCPVVGGDTFSPPAPFLGLVKKKNVVMLPSFFCSWGRI